MLKEGYAEHDVHEKVMEKLERNHCMQCVHYARYTYHHLIKNSLQNVAGAWRPHIVLQSARKSTGSSSTIKRWTPSLTCRSANKQQRPNSKKSFLVPRLDLNFRTYRLEDASGVGDAPQAIACFRIVDFDHTCFFSSMMSVDFDHICSSYCTGPFVEW